MEVFTMLDVKRNLTTMTDFYELTMSAGYLDEGYVDKIVCRTAAATPSWPVCSSSLMRWII